MDNRQHLLDCALLLQEQKLEQGVEKRIGDVLQGMGFLTPDQCDEVAKNQVVFRNCIEGYEIKSVLGKGGYGNV